MSNLEIGCDIPEGLYASAPDEGAPRSACLEIRDAQDVLWITLHKGGRGDPNRWLMTVANRILDCLQVPDEDHCVACLEVETDPDGAEKVNQALEYLTDKDPEALIWDGCDAAIIGVAERCSQPPLVVYCWDLLVKVFMDEGQSYEEACEWVAFSLEGAWIGDNTPLIMKRVEEEELNAVRERNGEDLSSGFGGRPGSGGSNGCGDAGGGSPGASPAD